MSALNKVDFPTFGRPTRAITGSGAVGGESALAVGVESLGGELTYGSRKKFVRAGAGLFVFARVGKMHGGNWRLVVSEPA